jgi:hypothetical protein
MRDATIGVLGLAVACLIGGCAAPTTQRVAVTDEATREEAAKQLQLAVQDIVAEQKRIARIYRTLATKASALCGEMVGPGTGMFTMRKPKDERGPVFEKEFGIGEQLTVLFVVEGGPAAAAGLQARDVIKKINDVATTDSKALIELYEKVSPEAPIKYEIERAGEPLTVMLNPERACRYPIVLNMQQIVNAFADGRQIQITRGMLNFAKDDNELALVVAHEMAHNVMKHIDAKKQNMAIGVLADIAAILLSRGQVNPNFSSMGAGAYSQEFEPEADYVGLYIMANSGLPIVDAPKFWRRMAAAFPANIKTNYSASHPSTSYRMVALEETVREINTKAEKREPLLPNMKDGKFNPPTK